MAGWSIVDRYLHESHLRLRRMDALDGGETVFKLGKKEAPDAPDFARTVITTIYLTEAEHALLAVLPASELRKRRFGVEAVGRTFGVDAFDGALSGLVLAEVEFRNEGELNQEVDLPDWIVREVTREEQFTGGALAHLTDDERRALVRSLRNRP